MEGPYEKGGAGAATEVDHTSPKGSNLGPCDSKSIQINDKSLNTGTCRIQILTHMDLRPHSVIQDVACMEQEMI